MNELEKHYSDLHGQMFQHFTGRSLRPHVEAIKALIDEYECKTLLDYGCGGAKLYVEHAVDRVVWGVNAYLYDPNHPKFNELPDHQFDMVVCTDVLEHIPELCVPDVLHRILTRARKCVYLNAAEYPAVKTLPNGENAHVTVRPLAWWHEALSKAMEFIPVTRKSDLPEVVLNGSKRHA